MNFFNKSRQRSPQELVRTYRENVDRLDEQRSGSGDARKAGEEVSRSLKGMKEVLNGDGEQDPSQDHTTQLANEIYSGEVLASFIKNMARFDFEGKKDSSQIFSLLLRRQIGSRLPTVDYISRNKGIIFLVLRGYENDDIAPNTGAILKEMLRHESLARLLLYSDEFYLFPQYIEKALFATSCDAFGNMKETLTRHKTMVAQYLDANYDRFFTSYQALVLSPNYVTKRQSLKLLGEILLDRANFNVMTKYIANKENLQVIMNTLRDKSKNIQFEAFHVFKVFVANPNKPPEIEAILRRNKDRLLVFLRQFHADREDEQFNDEKAYLIGQIDAL